VILRRRPRGKILAVKLGYNPNSSSLGVDVTFLLLGTMAITLLTPLVGFLLRFLRLGRAHGLALQGEQVMGPVLETASTASPRPQPPPTA
jgi:hypothetical protein